MKRYSTMHAFLVSFLFLALSAAAAAQPAQNDSQESPTRFDYENVKDEIKKSDLQGRPSADSFTNEFLREQVTSERWYIVLLCSVSIISLIVVLLFIKFSADYSARDVVNASGLNMIIFGTIILVLIVDTHEQLTAAIGVLGAIAGYLFGTLQRKTEQYSAASSRNAEPPEA